MDNTDNKDNNRNDSSTLDVEGIDTINNNQSKITNKTIDKPWLFQKGNPGGPGRPKGPSLKEWVRDRLQEMGEEERQEFLKTIPKDIIWKMAEGNPDTKGDVNVKGELKVLALDSELAKQYGITLTSEPKDNSKG